jgi:ribonuclease HI
MRRVVIHTDGACKGNPGPGAYGAVLVCGKHRKEISAAYRLTTNNRMELRAAIAALDLLSEPCEVELHSDSKYLIDAIHQNWIDGWKRRGWRTAANQAVKNRDLWQHLTEAMAPHRIRWHWLKGHAGHRENERCDELANQALASGVRIDDAGRAGE